MAAKLDQVSYIPLPSQILSADLLLRQTAEFIVGPKWAIARDPSVYNPSASATPAGKILADRGPAMVWPPP